MSKVKANDKFRFPIELDLAAYLPPEAQGGAVYDLSAILIHKGSSASHGHYGAPALRFLAHDAGLAIWLLPRLGVGEQVLAL